MHAPDRNLMPSSTLYLLALLAGSLAPIVLAAEVCVTYGLLCVSFCASAARAAFSFSHTWRCARSLRRSNSKIAGFSRSSLFLHLHDTGVYVYWLERAPILLGLLQEVDCGTGTTPPCDTPKVFTEKEGGTYKMVDYEDPGWNENRPLNPFNKNPYHEWTSTALLFRDMTCDWDKDNLFIRVAAFAKEKKRKGYIFSEGYDEIRVYLAVVKATPNEEMDTSTHLKTTDLNTKAGPDTDSIYFDAEGRSRDLTGLTIDGKKAPVSGPDDAKITYRVVAICDDPHALTGIAGKCSMKSRVEWECRRKPEFLNKSSAPAAWGARAVLLAGALAGALLA